MVKRSEGQPREDAHAECKRKIKELKEENAALRKSAQAFGELAERLSRNLRPGETRRPRPGRS